MRIVQQQRTAAEPAQACQIFYKSQQCLPLPVSTHSDRYTIACKCTYTHAQMHPCTCTYSHACHMHLHTHRHTHMHTYTRAYVHDHMQATCTCTHIRKIHTCRCTHTHPPTHMPHTHTHGGCAVRLTCGDQTRCFWVRGIYEVDAVTGENWSAAELSPSRTNKWCMEAVVVGGHQKVASADLQYHTVNPSSQSPSPICTQRIDGCGPPGKIRRPASGSRREVRVEPRNTQSLTTSNAL